MPLNYNISITSASQKNINAYFCTGATFTPVDVSVELTPVFSEVASINGAAYQPGSPLITATGGTVASTAPFIVTGATTAAVTVANIDGVYQDNGNGTGNALFTIPYGTTFDPDSLEHESGGSPRQYLYSAYLTNQVSNVTKFMTGTIFVNVAPPRVPVSNGDDAPCSVRETYSA